MRNPSTGGLRGEQFQRKIASVHELATDLGVVMDSDLDDSRKGIQKHGFHIRRDSSLGANVQKLEDDSVRFASLPGLEFCADNVIDNRVGTRRF
jgi:hypothetical protein